MICAVSLQKSAHVCAGGANVHVCVSVRACVFRLPDRLITLIHRLPAGSTGMCFAAFVARPPFVLTVLCYFAMCFL